MNEPSAPVSDGQFSLVAWNVFQGLHHRSRPKYMRRNDELVDHLASFDADVLVLPEAWHYRRPQIEWAEEAAAELGYTLHKWQSTEPSRPRDVCPWRMAIMTRIPATRLDDHVFPKLKKLGQRALVRVRLDDFDVTVAGAHLYGIHALRRGVRPWLNERAELRSATAHNDVIAGDMNIWGPVMRRDAGDLRLAVKGRTFPAARPHSQIDHVLVSDRLTVVNSAVLADLGSDHRAVQTALARS